MLSCCGFKLWGDLPAEVKVEILRYLPFTSLVRFMLLSKESFSLAKKVKIKVENIRIAGQTIRITRAHQVPLDNSMRLRVMCKVSGPSEVCEFKFVPDDMGGCFVQRNGARDMHYDQDYESTAIQTLFHFSRFLDVRTLEIVQANHSLINEKRATPLNANASDFMVSMVLKNESVLLRGQSDRFLSANEHRKDVWKTILKKVFEKFDVALTPKQMQQHFNNRKRKALSLENREKKYRKKTGAGRELAEKSLFKEENVSKTEFELQTYCNQRIATRDLPNADTLKVEEWREKEKGKEDGLLVGYSDERNKVKKGEKLASGSRSNESSTCTSLRSFNQIDALVDSDGSDEKFEGSKGCVNENFDNSLEYSQTSLNEKLNKTLEYFQTMVQEHTRMCRAFIELAECQKKGLKSIMEHTKPKDSFSIDPFARHIVHAIDIVSLNPAKRILTPGIAHALEKLSTSTLLAKRFRLVTCDNSIISKLLPCLPLHTSSIVLTNASPNTDFFDHEVIRTVQDLHVYNEAELFDGQLRRLQATSLNLYSPHITSNSINGLITVSAEYVMKAGKYNSDVPAASFQQWLKGERVIACMSFCIERVLQWDDLLRGVDPAVVEDVQGEAHISRKLLHSRHGNLLVANLVKFCELKYCS